MDWPFPQDPKDPQLFLKLQAGRQAEIMMGFSAAPSRSPATSGEAKGDCDGRQGLAISTRSPGAPSVFQATGRETSGDCKTWKTFKMASFRTFQNLKSLRSFEISKSNLPCRQFFVVSIVFENSRILKTSKISEMASFQTFPSLGRF